VLLDVGEGAYCIQDNFPSFATFEGIKKNGKENDAGQPV
jgi:hypothetical protein